MRPSSPTCNSVGWARSTWRRWQDRAAATLTVTISDQGCWRDPDPAKQGRVRGRGIPLMRALADDVTIDTSALGTTVCLRFDNVHAVAEADATVG